MLTANAMQNTRSGASDFVLFWFQSIDWGYATTNSSLMRQLFERSCEGCERLATNVIDLAAKRNEHYAGGRLVVRRRDIAPNDRHFGATMVVDAAVAQAKLNTVSAQGQVVDSSPAIAKAIFRTWLAWRSKGWRVVDWKQDSN